MVARSTQILLFGVFATLSVCGSLASESIGQTHCHLGTPTATQVYGLVPNGRQKVALFLVVGLDGTLTLKTLDSRPEKCSLRNISKLEAEHLWGSPLKRSNVVNTETRTFSFNFLRDHVLQIEFQFEKERIRSFRIKGTQLVPNGWQQV